MPQLDLRVLLDTELEDPVLEVSSTHWIMMWLPQIATYREA